MISGYTSEQKTIILDIIKKYFPNAQVFVFGSRANNAFKSTSDLDLCLKDKSTLDLSLWAKLEDELSQTNIPFKIDLVDWHRVSEEFQGIIAKGEKEF